MCSSDLLTLTAAGKIDVNANISTSNGDLNLVLDTGAGVGVVSGVLSLAGGSLTKLGAGTIALTAANTYSGGTTISAGSLGAYDNNALGAGVQGGTGSDTISKVLGLQFTLPIYQGGNVNSQIRQAVANQEKARQDLESATRQVVLATRQAFLGVNSGVAQVRALEAALVSTQSQLDSTRLGQEVGVRTGVDVLNAQQELVGARIAVVSDARYVLSLYRSEKFVFENPARFAGAVFRNAANGADGLLESNIVPDVGTCALSSGTPSSRTLRIVPPDGILGLDVCEIPAATGSGELRSLPGTHTFVVAGDGHTELWMDGDADVTRVEWRPGVVFAPGLAMVHRHTNSGPTAARLLGIQYGSLRTPMARDKMAAYGREK